MVNAVLVCIAVLLTPASVRVREPSWPMAAEATETRAAPVRVAPAPTPLEVAVPEDRPSAPRPRVIVPPGPGWPSASVEPASEGHVAKRERRAVARRSRR